MAINTLTSFWIHAGDWIVVGLPDGITLTSFWIYAGDWIVV